MTLGDELEAMQRGRRRRTALHSGHLPSGTSIDTPVFLVKGRSPGPTLWLSGGIHGDEISGVEAVRTVVREVDPKSLSGSLIAVPVVNLLAFLGESRYLPDRRDLNRAFPGSARGSLASRLARDFVTNVVDISDVGIDFHSGSDHRYNHPQIRIDLTDDESGVLGNVFGADFLVDAHERDGSLRAAVRAMDKRVLLFEGGEPHRFDREVIDAAVDGTLRVMEHLGMVPSGPPRRDPVATITRSRWIRSRRSGLFMADVVPGQAVERGQPIGRLTDVDSVRERPVTAPDDGWILGMTRKPVVHQGNALANLGMAS